MKIITSFLLLLCILNAKEFTNKLQYETSPYLLDHKNNPVNWLAWNLATFEKAKKENKPIFLSIGYSTCHWCHVMANKSFTNIEIANLLNKYFICIKVDREEMSHIDSLYQDVHLKVKHHSGGWPLSIFMTPSKEVFDIRTYVPATKESYSEGLDTLVLRLGEMYKTQDKKLLQIIADNKETLSKPVVYREVKDEDISIKTLAKSLKGQYDDIYTGFSNGRKFPEAAKLSLMMDLAQLSGDEELKEYSYEMLDTMALRGLYDHVEGGFFRYSVDAAWEIPHFEKMLYSQSELISVYTKAYIYSNKKLYKDVVVETIYMLNKRYKKDDLFYGASDADTNHIEGEYFTFTSKEIAKTGFAFDENFEGKIHLNVYGDERPNGYYKLREILSKVRATKEYPFIDKKINTAWNSLVIEALYNAAYIDKKYALQAELHLAKLEELMFYREELYHQTILGLQPKQKGLLEDYSFYISALISGYEYNYDERKLDFAEYLLAKAKSKFYKKGTWYLSDDSMKIKAGSKDKYYTSALSKMLQNIAKLASLKASFTYEKLLVKSLDNLKSELQEKQADAPALATAYLMQKLNIATLKSQKSNLQDGYKQIKAIKYPYTLTKSAKYNDYLSCTIRRCFSKEKTLQAAINAIDSDIRK